MSPAFLLEGCGTREAVKKFRGHVFPRWFSVTVSLLSALFAATGLFFFLGGRHKLALYYAGSALLLLVFNLVGKAFLVRRLSSVLDQILGGDPGFTVCFYENYFSIVRQKDQKLIPVYYSRINRIACRDGIMAVFTGENLCIPFRDPEGGQVWDDLCRFLKEKNPSIAVCG